MQGVMHEKFGLEIHRYMTLKSSSHSPNWTLRRAVASDAEALRACASAAYQQYLKRMDKPPGPMFVNYALAIDQHQVWVVYSQLGERIIGGLVLIPVDDHVLLDNIFVHPDFQGQGIGRALLALADEETLRQGFHELRLYTHEKMTENISLYTRLGWTETHRARQDGYGRVFFCKRL